MLTSKKDIFNFGKHYGKSVKYVLKHEPDYLEWLVNNTEITNFKPKMLEKIKAKSEKHPRYSGISYGDLEF